MGNQTHQPAPQNQTNIRHTHRRQEGDLRNIAKHFKAQKQNAEDKMNSAQLENSDRSQNATNGKKSGKTPGKKQAEESEYSKKSEESKAGGTPANVSSTTIEDAAPQEG